MVDELIIDKYILKYFFESRDLNELSTESIKIIQYNTMHHFERFPYKGNKADNSVKIIKVKTLEIANDISIHKWVVNHFL